MPLEVSSWDTIDFKALKDDINWDEYHSNVCRSLVEVPGGIEWKIRELYERYPQYCWKFIDGQVIVQYYLDEATKALNGVYEKLTNIPKFYAHLPFFSSPFEISVQPKFLEKIRIKLHQKMQESYSASSLIFEEIELFEKMPCAIKEHDTWYRGRIVSINKTSAVVFKVDYGVDKIVFFSDIKPLLNQFGRIPPLVMKCRVKDVFVNDLDTAKVEQFKKLIEDIRNLVRVEICNNEEPYFVNLFHPTIDNQNLGKAFYRPPDHAAREKAKQRKWLEHKRRQENENDSDFDDQDSDELEEEEEQVPTYIKTFGKCFKFPFGHTEVLTMIHVENSKMIYLRADWMQTKFDEISHALSNEWNSFPLLQSGTIFPGIACVVSCESNLFRAVVEATDGDDLNLFLLDVGRNIRSPITAVRALSYKEPFIENPMIYVVSLNRDYYYFPHPSETICLKELLPVGSSVVFNGLKTRNRVPVVGTMEYSTGESVDELLNLRLQEKRIDLLARDVIPYSGQHIGKIDLAFEHRLRCNPTLMKGRLTEFVLP